MNSLTNNTEKMATKIKMAMKKKFKLLLFFTIVMLSSISYSQNNADPAIGILMIPGTVTQGKTGILDVTTGNYGNMTITANSVQVTISVGVNAEILGIASSPASDTRWTQYSLTTGSANTIVLRNTSGSFDSDIQNLIPDRLGSG